MKWKTKKTVASICPNCGVKLDAAAHREGATPSPEDISMCLECGQWLVYKDDLTLRQMKPEDLDRIEKDDPKALKEMLRFQKTFEKMVEYIRIKSQSN